MSSPLEAVLFRSGNQSLLDDETPTAFVLLSIASSSRNTHWSIHSLAVQSRTVQSHRLLSPSHCCRQDTAREQTGTPEKAHDAPLAGPAGTPRSEASLRMLGAGRQLRSLFPQPGSSSGPRAGLCSWTWSFLQDRASDSQKKTLFLDLSRNLAMMLGWSPLFTALTGLCWSAREQLLQEVSPLPATDFPRRTCRYRALQRDGHGEQPARSPSACARAGEEA